MKNIRNQLLYIIAFIFLSTLPLFSKVVVTDTTGTLTPAGIAELESELKKSFDLNGVAFVDSAAFANIHGYPVGTSILKGFPRFMVGLSFSATFANMRFFDNTRWHDPNMIPVGSLNPVFLIGLGLKNGFDLMLKFMFFNEALYKPPINHQLVTLKKLRLYSIGLKFRYNIAKAKKVLPGIFNFGGFSLGVSVDYMDGQMQIVGDLDYPAGTLSLSVPPAGDYSCIYETGYSASAKWMVVSGNPELRVHVNMFAIFDLYTGFGFPFHYATADIKINMSGDLIREIDDTVVGRITAVGDEEYMPFYIQPVWVGGVELNVYILRFTFETMINLYNRKDISAQFGARTQW